MAEKQFDGGIDSIKLFILRKEKVNAKIAQRVIL
jgi:hypothetical protein